MVLLNVAVGARDGLADPQVVIEMAFPQEMMHAASLLRTDQHGWIEITTSKAFTHSLPEIWGKLFTPRLELPGIALKERRDHLPREQGYSLE